MGKEALCINNYYNIIKDVFISIIILQ
jgi:hypothetical protein